MPQESDFKMDARVSHDYWIYFIHAPELANSPIKIGMAISLPKRLKALQVGSPVILEIIGAIRGTSEIERELHSLFADHRLHGEWFSNEIYEDVINVLLAEEKMIA